LQFSNSRKTGKSLAVPGGSDRIFVYAKLGRIRIGNYYLFGAGLGNTLFAWARAEIAAKKYSLPMLPPVWQRLTSGGGWISALKLLRSRRSAVRTYSGLLGEPQSLGATCATLLTFVRASRVDETLLAQTLESEQPRSRRLVFVFEGMRNGFVPLVSHRAFISARFREMITSSALPDISKTESSRFACHVRMGDYNPLPGSPSETNARLPLDWYIEQLKTLSEHWPAIPIDLFSDGNDAELNELLQLPGVRRADYGNPVADLVTMTRARLLVCSGSSFSAWAAFLGQMPTIWYPERYAPLFGEQALPNAIDRQMKEPLPVSFYKTVVI
jgi:hypothetical protein